MRYTNWGKNETVNADGKLVFWEIIEEIEYYPFTGEINEVLEKHKELNDRLKENGIFDKYIQVEIDDRGYTNLRYEDPAYFVVGKRVENDEEYVLRVKIEKKKKKDDKYKKDVELKKKEKEERDLLAKLKEKYKE